MEEISKEEEEWNLAQIKQRKSRLHAKKIGSVVRRLMSQSGYGQVQANEQLLNAWSDAVGSTLSPLTRPGKISRGVLSVLVANSATAQELAFQKRQVISRLAKTLPSAQIRDIKPRVGDFS